MNKVVPLPVPPRVPPVEPDLLGSAIFLLGEYLERIRIEAELEGKETPEIDTRAALDLLAAELGTAVPQTLALYLRVTALFRLLAQSPSLGRLVHDFETGKVSETALLAAARLDLAVRREGKEGTADFDPKEFRAALAAD
jgi:hypothetical protein